MHKGMEETAMLTEKHMTKLVRMTCLGAFAGAALALATVVLYVV